MPLPSVHFLVGAGAAELTRSERQRPRWRLWLFGGALGVLPDLDGIGLLLGRGSEFDGLFTRTPLAVLPARYSRSTAAWTPRTTIAMRE